MGNYLIKESIFPKENTWLLKGKKVKNSLNFIAATCLNGPLTTREAAKFVLSKTPDYEYKPPRDIDTKELDHAYNRLVTGRETKTISGKKLKKYPGLLKENYIVKIGVKQNKKKQLVATYFPSIKGCIFALGFRFNDKELKTFIENASKHYLYFAYLNKILKETSLIFVRKIFCEPIQYLIKKGKITLDEEFWLCFNNIADLNGFELYKIISKAHNESDKKFSSKIKKIKKQKKNPFPINLATTDSKTYQKIWKLMDNTWYDELDKEKWVEKIINVLQNGDNDMLSHQIEERYDENLLFYTMRAIHNSFYNAEGVVPPLKHEQNILIKK